MSPRARAVARIPTYVVDANVAVACVLPEVGTEPATRVFGAARDGEARLVAPSFWLLECGNVLWKHVRRRVLDVDTARAAFERLNAMPITAIDSALLLETALDIALLCDLTTYDSLYVATALFAQAPLITADGKVLDAVTRDLPEVGVVNVDAFYPREPSG